MLLKVVEIVSLRFSNVEWMQLGISSVARQWFENTQVHVLIISYVYLQHSKHVAFIQCRACSLGLSLGLRPKFLVLALQPKALSKKPRSYCEMYHVWLSSAVACKFSAQDSKQALNVGDLVWGKHPQNLGGIGMGSPFSAENLQYFWNEAREHQSYYLWPTVSCIRAIDWY